MKSISGWTHDMDHLYHFTYKCHRAHADSWDLFLSWLFLTYLMVAMDSTAQWTETLPASPSLINEQWTTLCQTHQSLDSLSSGRCNERFTTPPQKMSVCNVLQMSNHIILQLQSLKICQNPAVN